MLEEMTSKEITEWQAYFEIKEEERKKEEQRAQAESRAKSKARG